MSPSTTVPELPPHVWSNVMRYVKRDQAWFTDEGDAEYHQRDLVSAMRVSSEMNTAAAPHLYSTIVTNNVGLFLQGIEYDPDLKVERFPHIPSIHRKSQRKLALLTHTKLLNVLTPSIHPFAAYSRIFSSAKQWDDTDLTHQEIARGHFERIKYHLLTGHLFFTLLGDRKASIIPNLQHLTFGTSQNDFWGKMEPLSDTLSGSTDKSIIFETVEIWFRLFGCFRSPNVCYRSSLGIHAYPRGRFLIMDNTLSHQTSDQHFPTRGRVDFIRGTKNVFYCNVPQFPWDESIAHIIVGGRFFEHLFDQIAEERKIPMRGTKVEIYGAFRPDPEAYQRVKKQDLEAHLVRMEKAKHERMEESFMDELCEAWSKVVKLGLWEERPRCPCCGLR